MTTLEHYENCNSRKTDPNLIWNKKSVSILFWTVLKTKCIIKYAYHFTIYILGYKNMLLLCLFSVKSVDGFIRN